MEIQPSAESELSVSSSQLVCCEWSSRRAEMDWLTGFLKTWSLSQCSIKSIYTSKPVSRQKSRSSSYLCVYIKPCVGPYCFNIWTVGCSFPSYLYFPATQLRSKSGCQTTVILTYSSCLSHTRRWVSVWILLLRLLFCASFPKAVLNPRRGQRCVTYTDSVINYLSTCTVHSNISTQTQVLQSTNVTSSTKVKVSCKI